jgi:hypothetical protein
MKALLLPLVLAAVSVPTDNPTTYLASIGNIPLTPDGSVEKFSISTWGVDFLAVCHIPYGWRITAGNSASPDGELDGEGSEGITWFHKCSPKELADFVLLQLYGTVQRADVPLADGYVPATFSGQATINRDDGDRKVPLNYNNVGLLAARQCPSDAR